VEPRALSVCELGAYLSQRFSEDLLLRHLWVRGELSEIKRHSSGHTYFTLSEGESRLGGVLFRGDAFRQISWPRVGDAVLVEGRIAVYEARGVYQIYALRLIPLGAGAQSRAREELRRLLEREGLLDPRLKRPLPPFPEVVALVTSPTGAAVQDVIKVGGKRFPSCRFFVVPALVQGLGAPASLVRALRRAGHVPGVEAIMLVRGGGAREDLSPFDDEQVVRAARHSPVPLVTGIGHQTDLSLCDMVADASTPTPSAAVEKLLPDQQEILDRLGSLARRGHMTLSRSHDRASLQIDHWAQRGSRAVGSCLKEGEKTLDRLVQRHGAALGSALYEVGKALDLMEERLEALSPWHALRRGFPFCEREDGTPFVRGEELFPGDRLRLRFMDAVALAQVEAVERVIPPSEAFDRGIKP